MKTIERKLYKVDAAGQSVGRLATQIAALLRGKNRPEFTPHLDSGGIVEVANITKLKFTGKKLGQKQYHHYSGYLGGLKTKKMSEIYVENPGEILSRAVRKMLPDTKLRVGMLKRLIIK